MCADATSTGLAPLTVSKSSPSHEDPPPVGRSHTTPSVGCGVFTRVAGHTPSGPKVVARVAQVAEHKMTPNRARLPSVSGDVARK